MSNSFNSIEKLPRYALVRGPIIEICIKMGQFPNHVIHIEYAKKINMYLTKISN